MESIHLETDDCGQLAELAGRAGWEMRCLQVEPGTFRGVCDIVSFPGLQVCVGKISAALRIQGRVPDGWRAITMAGAGGCCCGRALGHDSLCYIAPGDPAFWQTPADHAVDLVMVEARLLDAEMRAVGNGSLAEVMPHTAVLAVSSDHLGPLRRLLHALLSEAAEPGSKGRDRSCAVLSSALVRYVAVLLGAPLGRQGLPAHPDPEAGHVAAALTRIEENLHRSIPLRELCQRAEVCPRTLQTSFMHQTGVGPNRFVRELRLNRVRSRLRGARRGTDSVKQIAIEHGFHHLGHFSRDYVTLFGELPSQTLHQP